MSNKLYSIENILKEMGFVPYDAEDGPSTPNKTPERANPALTLLTQPQKHDNPPEIRVSNDCPVQEPAIPWKLIPLSLPIQERPKEDIRTRYKHLDARSHIIQKTPNRANPALPLLTQPQKHDNPPEIRVSNDCPVKEPAIPWKLIPLSLPIQERSKEDIRSRYKHLDARSHIIQKDTTDSTQESIRSILKDTKYVPTLVEDKRPKLNKTSNRAIPALPLLTEPRKHDSPSEIHVLKDCPINKLASPSKPLAVLPSLSTLEGPIEKKHSQDNHLEADTHTLQKALKRAISISPLRMPSRKRGRPPKIQDSKENRAKKKRGRPPKKGVLSPSLPLQKSPFDERYKKDNTLQEPKAASLCQEMTCLQTFADNMPPKPNKDTTDSTQESIRSILKDMKYVPTLVEDKRPKLNKTSNRAIPALPLLTEPRKHDSPSEIHVLKDCPINKLASTSKPLTVLTSLSTLEGPIEKKHSQDNHLEADTHTVQKNTKDNSQHTIQSILEEMTYLRTFVENMPPTPNKSLKRAISISPLRMPSRKRGRPPKIQDSKENPVKKKRGRPPKKGVLSPSLKLPQSPLEERYEKYNPLPDSRAASLCWTPHRAIPELPLLTQRGKHDNSSEIRVLKDCPVKKPLAVLPSLPTLEGPIEEKRSQDNHLDADTHTLQKITGLRGTDNERVPKKPQTLHYSYFTPLPPEYPTDDEDEEHKYFVKKAKNLRKSMGDETESLQCTRYLETVRYLILTARKYELDFKTKGAIIIYKEAINYIRSVYSTLKSFMGSPRSAFSQIDILSLRIVALLYKRIVYMNAGENLNNKTEESLQEMPSVDRLKESRPRIYRSMLLHVPGIPDSTLLFNKYHTYMCVAHELWNQADIVCRSLGTLDILIAADRECGKLSQSSSITHLDKYIVQVEIEQKNKTVIKCG